MRSVPILIAMAVSGSPASSFADDFFLTGNDVYDLCEMPGNAPEQALNAYVMAISDMATLYSDKTYCLTTNATASQLRGVLCTFLERNPSTRNEAGVSLTVRAYTEAWRCQ